MRVLVAIVGVCAGALLACGPKASAEGGVDSGSADADAGAYDSGYEPPPDVAQGPYLPGKDLLDIPGEDAKILLADGHQLYALLIATDGSCNARWVATTGIVSNSTIWSGKLCQNRFLADQSDSVIFWAAANQQGSGSADYSTGTTDLYLLPKAGGGGATPFSSQAFAIDSVAVDGQSVYWDIYGVLTDYGSPPNETQGCTGGEIFQASRSNMQAQQIAGNEFCPSAIRSDGTNTYWFTLTPAGTSVVLRESPGGTGAPQDVPGFGSVGPLSWLIADGTAYLGTGAQFWQASLPDGGPVPLLQMDPISLGILEQMAFANGVLAWMDIYNGSEGYRAAMIANVAPDGGSPEASTLAGNTTYNSPAIATDGTNVYVEYLDSNMTNHLVAVPVH